MTDGHLPRVSRRILNTPQLISESGAAAILGALGPRIGVSALRLPSGEVQRLDSPPALTARTVHASSRDFGSDRVFAFDPATGIARIPIEGELVHRFGHLEPFSGMTGYDAIKMKVAEAAADPAVKGILLDIDSPGGEVYGCAACAEAIFEARAAKPIWAVANELATSAAYFLASAAHNVFVPETADLGSIGVVMMHVDMSAALKQEGLNVTLIHAGAHKVDGNPFQPLPAAVREEFERGVLAVYDVFVAAVARNRGLREAAVRGTEAQIYMGADAVKAGLADGVASIDNVDAEFAAQLGRHEGLAIGAPRLAARSA
jgi:signal peptide peptidase SppA